MLHPISLPNICPSHPRSFPTEEQCDSSRAVSPEVCKYCAQWDHGACSGVTSFASQLPSSQDWGLPRHALGLLCAGFSSRGRLSSSSFGPHTVFQMHPVFPQFHILVPGASGSALLNMLAHSLGTETLSPCSSSGFLCL